MQDFADQTGNLYSLPIYFVVSPMDFVTMQISPKDEALLALLAENARTPVADLARRLGLSRTTVQARIERLERANVISGYTLRLGEQVERHLVKAHVLIRVRPKHASRTIAELTEMAEVRMLHSVSGEVDLIAIVAAGSVAALDAVLDRIGELDGVERTQTSVILATKVDRSSS